MCKEGLDCILFLPYLTSVMGKFPVKPFKVAESNLVESYTVAVGNRVDIRIKLLEL